MVIEYAQGRFVQNRLRVAFRRLEGLWRLRICHGHTRRRVTRGPDHVLRERRWRQRDQRHEAREP